MILPPPSPITSTLPVTPLPQSRLSSGWKLERVWEQVGESVWFVLLLVSGPTLLTPLRQDVYYIHGKVLNTLWSYRAWGMGRNQNRSNETQDRSISIVTHLPSRTVLNIVLSYFFFCSYCLHLCRCFSNDGWNAVKETRWERYSEIIMANH